eukprot:TRINITY_DN105363_c0_g1_i1.p7 TRINITY_DN105363_c0_g1~~TRINITY_DN105363_c0_g1_i1.p7  ORF type:complete len:123 (+),score=4.69 TRINITY_DN105363_c0_g1_i1:162-530(+)
MCTLAVQNRAKNKRSPCQNANHLTLLNSRIKECPNKGNANFSRTNNKTSADPNLLLETARKALFAMVIKERWDQPKIKEIEKKAQKLPLQEETVKKNYITIINEACGKGIMQASDRHFEQDI